MPEDPQADERSLLSLLGHHARRYWRSEPARHKDPVPHRPARSGGTAQRLIRSIPFLLAGLFLGSFAWDFDGLEFTVSNAGLFVHHGSTGIPDGANEATFVYSVSLEGLLVTIAAAGLIGFFTNWLAITMLFHPRRRRPVLGQGVIPAQRERVIHRVARAISQELVSEEIIKERIHHSQIIPRYRAKALEAATGVLSDEGFRSDIKAMAELYIRQLLSEPDVQKKLVDLAMSHVDSVASSGLARMALRLYKTVNREGIRRQMEQAIRDLPDSVGIVLDELDRVLDQLPDNLAKYGDDVERWLTQAIMTFVGNLDVYEMAVQNMRQFDEQQLEALIKNSSNDQLQYIKYLGGLLGMLGGLVVFDKWLALPLLAITIGLVLLLDHMLNWLRMKRAAI